MPAYNFQPRFAAAVESGEKRQTVRAHRRHDPRPGQTAYLYTVMRTAVCRLLATKIITRVEALQVATDGTVWLGPRKTHMIPLLGADADAFARDDGFADAEALVGWITRTHGLPFAGTVTYW